MSNLIENRLADLERRMTLINRSHDALKARCEDVSSTVDEIEGWRKSYMLSLLGLEDTEPGEPTLSEILDEETEDAKEEKDKSTNPVSS